MDARIQIVAALGSGIVLLVVLELVRQRRLMERYALLWLFSGLCLLGLGIFRGALTTISEALGIAYPPNALFFIAFGFVLLLLLHFSTAFSRLTDQAKVLAQHVALLEARIRQLEGDAPAPVPPPAGEAAVDEALERQPAGVGAPAPRSG